MANTSMSLVNLDFDTLKSSFIQYLKNQDQFKDYNFDASNMNVLMDILAMNTYKNAFYLNMINAEGFLDSAQLKSSVYSISKELNYLPRSIKSAVASITMFFQATGASQPYIIRKGETFTTLIKSTSFTFSVADDIVLTSPNTSYTSTFNIYEGYYNADSYIMDYTVNYQLFPITNENIDTASLSVLVYEDGNIVPQKFKLATTLLGLTENSNVYFIQPSSLGGYEVLFGDGILGRKPKNGSTIVLDYRVASGPEANGAKVFAQNFDPTGVGELVGEVSVVVNSYGSDNSSTYSVNGANAESIDSIRYYAPRHFQTQERAVTVTDYETILKSHFPEIEAVAVYGGEEASPPQFGKVFVSVSIKNVDGLPASKQAEYYNFIKARSPLSIDAIFVNPEYTYVSVNALVNYNVNVTNRSKSNLQAAIVLAISEYAVSNLDNFKTSLRYSKFIRLIDDIDTSVISNDTTLHLYKKITPVPGTALTFIMNFNAPLYESYYFLNNAIVDSDSKINAGDAHTLSSSKFFYNGVLCELDDDGNGTVRIVKVDSDTHEPIKTIGSVNYATGYVQLNNFSVDSFAGSVLKVYAKTLSKDITSGKNDVLRIEADEINITMQEVSE
jgi:hypothetical protein